MRNIFFAFILLSIFACDKTIKKAKFEGDWIEKSLIVDNNFNSSLINAEMVYLPAFRFFPNKADSLIAIFSADSMVVKHCRYIYDSYNTPLNKDRETMILFDYNNDEVFFWDRKKDKVYRYQRLSKLPSNTLKEEIKAYFKL